MDLNQYLEVRRRFNTIRREAPASSRIIFDEFAILCTLHGTKGLSATQLAAGQGISCPTMTHRGSHLTQLGYMSRAASDDDRRRLRCVLTRKGTSYVHRTTQSMLAGDLPACLEGLEPSALVPLVAQMGTLPMTADALTLLCFARNDVRSMPVMRIVEETGLLQPTVSMAVLRLEESGCIEDSGAPRGSGRRPMRRGLGCVLTDLGADAAQAVARRVEAL